MAVAQSFASKLIISNQTQNFQRKLQYNQIKELRSGEDQKATVQSIISENWNFVRFETNVVLKKQELQDLNVSVYKNRVEVKANLTMNEIKQVDNLLVMKVKIEFINRQLFESVQEIQNSVKTTEQRKEAFDRLLNINMDL